MIFYHDILSYLRKGHVLILTETYDKSDAKTTKKRCAKRILQINFFNAIPVICDLKSGKTDFETLQM